MLTSDFDIRISNLKTEFKKIMPKYCYTAKDTNGKTITEEIDSFSQEFVNMVERSVIGQQGE